LPFETGELRFVPGRLPLEIGEFPFEIGEFRFAGFETLPFRLVLEFKPEFAFRPAFEFIGEPYGFWFEKYGLHGEM
jgi:hypothetical protein